MVASGMRQLNRDSINPLYLQVSDYIRDKIYSQEWDATERIPSERQLMELLDVSRGTVKRGIETLVKEGILVQHRGSGTFVARPALPRPSGQSLISIAESFRAEGIRFETRVVEMKRLRADAACAKHLGLVEGSDILLLRRLRLSGNKPLVFMESRLNLAECPGLSRFDYTKRALFSAVEETSRRKISYARGQYGACVAGERYAAVLGCEERDPILHVEQVVYLEDDAAIEWSSMWYPPNLYQKTLLFREAK